MIRTLSPARSKPAAIRVDPFTVLPRDPADLRQALDAFSAFTFHNRHLPAVPRRSNFVLPRIRCFARLFTSRVLAAVPSGTPLLDSIRCRPFRSRTVS